MAIFVRMENLICLPITELMYGNRTVFGCYAGSDTGILSGAFCKVWSTKNELPFVLARRFEVDFKRIDDYKCLMWIKLKL